MKRAYLTLAILILLAGLISLTSCSPNNDDDPPSSDTLSVVSVAPLNNATDVELSSNISITFSVEVDTTTLADAITFDPDIAFGFTYSNKTATLTPIGDLAPDQSYTITIDTSLADTTGEKLLTDYSWSFETLLGISNGARYFPISDGDIWYYKDTLGFLNIKQVQGDTTINGVSTKRVLLNLSTTKEAWSIDDDAFYTHLLLGNVEFRPPLAVPLNLVYNVPYEYGSKVYIYSGGTTYTDTTSGNLTFTGYVSHAVNAGTYDSVIALYYEGDGEGEDPYYEYYAPGVGLLDNGVILLDSAYINGVWYRP